MKITLKKSKDGTYLFESPYDSDLVEDIKIIKYEFREWGKPYWRVLPHEHDEAPVEEYLIELGKEYSEKLGIEFINLAAATPLEQAKINAESRVNLLRKLKKVLADYPENSIQISFYPPEKLRLSIRYFLDDRELYASLIALADEKESNSAFIYLLGESEFNILSKLPAINNNPIELELVNIIDAQEAVVKDKKGEKYFAASVDLAEEITGEYGFLNGECWIIGNEVSSYLHPIEIGAFYKIDDEYFDSIEKYQLIEDFFDAFNHAKEKRMFDIDGIYISSRHPHTYKLSKCSWDYDKILQFIDANSKRLISWGFNPAPYYEKLSIAEEKMKHLILKRFEEDSKNAKENMKAFKLKNCTKEELLDIAKERGVDAKKSWKKEKIYDSLNYTHKEALEYFEIPDAPDLSPRNIFK